jgi:hypothetical protein
MGVVDSLFMHNYDIRARVKMSDGRIMKCRIPLQARFANSDDITAAVKREIEWKLEAKIVKVLQMYDANEVS